MKYPVYFLGLSLWLFSLNANAQQDEVKENYSVYELMSSYYNEDFKPFKKRNIYLGLALSLEDRISQNSTNLIETIIDGERLNYDLSLKVGYYTGNYGMAGINIAYFQNKFNGEVFRDPDTLQTNTILRGYSITPNFRSSIPLTANERLSFFTELGLTFGRSNSLERRIKNLDEVDKSYSTDYNFRLGISPGVTFFALESFALEVQLNVLGYELRVSDKSRNEEDPSRQVRHNVDFNIDILYLELGLAYYLGSKKSN